MTEQSKVAHMYSRCIALEQQLKEEMKQKHFYDPVVRTVRAELCSAYENLLFSDYAGAQVRKLSWVRNA